ncbi:MAG: hypothetical protein RLZZ437_32 [Pseudomonadota bacterium]|jgi:hypothetical protein
MSEAEDLGDVLEMFGNTIRQCEARAAYLTRMDELCDTLSQLDKALPPGSPVGQAVQALLDAIISNPYALLDLQDAAAFR